jgi:peptide/nickel transport system substrate-binding protein
MKRLATVLTCVLLLAGIAAVAAQSQDEEDGGGGGGKTVFQVGDPQGIDSMNPLIGVTVAAYEAWNIHYPTLTDKAAEDFSTTPGLAESWEESDGGRTWTYTMKPNLKWSDGEPLTAEDVAWTVNTSRDEAWINHSSVTGNLEAEATDDTTLVIRSKVPDPKLPTMDVYVLPEHVWGELSEDERGTYDATEGVGGGPFVLEEFKKGQFARFRANPNYHGGRPQVDEVVLRKFNNPDAMVAALRTGDIDAAQDIPGAAFDQLAQDDNIQTVEGNQGSMTEVGINGGDGLAKPHPALLDQSVRQAIGHAIDKETIVARVLNGHGEVAHTLSVSPDPAWTPDIPEDQVFDFDLDKANSMLEEAGYRDTDGDGIREMPGGGRPLNFEYMVRSDGETGPEIAEFVTGWLREIGIATTEKVEDDSQLTTTIGKGDYDMFAWGWTPFVDPDPMLSYFTCDQLASDPDDPTNYYNDANHCDEEYDRLYEQQKVELDEERRVELVHEMLTRFQQSGTYHVLYTEPDLQAYVKDRWEGFVRQPAETGPVLYSNSSPSYARLKVASASSGGGDDSGGSGGIIAIVVAVVLALALGGWMLSRRRTADERE